MMSLSSLYVLFFAIAVGAFAPTEASSAPAVVDAHEAAHPTSFALLADQHQQKGKAVPVQKESSPDPRQQNKTPFANVLAMAGTAAVVLVLMFFFVKQMKGYLAKEREEEKKEIKPGDFVKLIERLERDMIKEEKEWRGKTAEERKKEARRRAERIRDIVKTNEWEPHYTTVEQMVEEAERLEYCERREEEKKREEAEWEAADPVAYAEAKARNRN